MVLFKRNNLWQGTAKGNYKGWPFLFHFEAGHSLIVRGRLAAAISDFCHFVDNETT